MLFWFSTVHSLYILDQVGWFRRNLDCKPKCTDRNNWHIIVIISLESREFRISSPCFFNSYWEWRCMYECQFYSVVFWSNWTGNYTLLQSGKDRAFLHVWPLAVEDARSQNDIVERVLKLKKRNLISISTSPYSNEKNEKKPVQSAVVIGFTDLIIV